LIRILFEPGCSSRTSGTRTGSTIATNPLGEREVREIRYPNGRSFRTRYTDDELAQINATMERRRQESTAASVDRAKRYLAAMEEDLGVVERDEERASAAAAVVLVKALANGEQPVTDVGHLERVGAARRAMSKRRPRSSRPMRGSR
jgi:hypothetical protein